MKKFIFIIIVFFCTFGLTAADVTSNPGAFGLLFQLESVLTEIKPYTDGVLAGAGLKYVLNDQLSFRALASVLMTPVINPEYDTETTIQLSAVCEYHLVKGEISPYLGVLGGVSFLIQDETYSDQHLGILGGAEIRIYQNFSFYAEYSAMFTFTIEGTSFSFGNNANLGIIIYLNS